MTYTTLLWCGSVDSGPDGCCGCFNGRQNGRHIEFYCNECGRVVFDATSKGGSVSEGGISQESLDVLVDTLDKIVINHERDTDSLKETGKSLRAVITALGNLKGVV